MPKLDRIDPTALATNPRATLSAWKRYEPTVLAAMAQHPRPYVFRPSNMAPSTVASRLRDAIRGKLAFDHESVRSVDEVRRWYAEVVVKSDLAQVYIGPLEKVTEILAGDHVSTTPAPFSFDSLSFEEVSAFALLLSTGRLNGPVEIRCAPDLTLLPMRPNVEQITKPDGTLLLI